MIDLHVLYDKYVRIGYDDIGEFDFGVCSSCHEEVSVFFFDLSGGAENDDQCYRMCGSCLRKLADMVDVYGIDYAPD